MMGKYSQKDLKELLDTYLEIGSISEIARMIGVSRERARQLLNRAAGGNARRLWEERVAERIRNAVQSGIFGLQAVAKHLGLSHRVVRRIANKYGIELRNSISPEDIRQIVSLAEQGLTYKEISQRTGWSIPTVNRVLTKHWGKRHLRKAHKMPPEEKQRILDLYQQGKKLDEIVALTGWSWSAVYWVIRNRYGKLSNRKSRKLTDQDKLKIIELRSKGLSMKKISELTGIPYSTVNKFFRKLSAKEKPQRKKKPINPEDVIAFYKQTNNIHATARHFGISYATVKRILGPLAMDHYKRLQESRAKRHQTVLELLNEGLSYRKVAERVGLSYSSVVRIANQHGYKRRQLLTEKQIEQILELDQQGLSISEISRRTGKSWRTIAQVAIGKRKISEDLQEEILELYNNNQTPLDIARRFGLPLWAVFKTINQDYNLLPYLDDAIAEKLIIKVMAHIPVDKIAQELGVPVDTVEMAAKTLGVKPKMKSEKVKDLEDKIVSFYLEGKPIQEMVSELGVSTSTIYNVLYRRGIKPNRRA